MEYLKETVQSVLDSDKGQGKVNGNITKAERPTEKRSKRFQKEVFDKLGISRMGKRILKVKRIQWSWQIQEVILKV